MPVLFLKAMDYGETKVDPTAIELRLEIRVDGQNQPALRRNLKPGRRWILDRSLPFNGEVRLTLFDEDVAFDDRLGRVRIGTDLVPRERFVFDEDNEKLVLWYEVLPDGISRTDAHRPAQISVRQMLGRLGRGGLTANQHRQLTWAVNQKRTTNAAGDTVVVRQPADARLYRLQETISLRDVWREHAPQDGDKGKRQSLRRWIYEHCNPWGEESVLPIAEMPRASIGEEILFGKRPGWTAVADEKSRFLAGYQEFSRRNVEDEPRTHATLDWNLDLVADPRFMYLHSYTTYRRKFENGRGYPKIHNEWESGSFPIEWRPFWGEYVTIYGRHIYDLGHAPIITEIHPIHTIVREHTSAAPLGDQGAMVPVNRTIVGMGACGGFPKNVGSRWLDETGENPPAGLEELADCWFTNLRRHPLKHKIFPPVKRPSPSAQLRARVILAELISVADWTEMASFLKICQEDEPSGNQVGFRRWDRQAGFPRRFVPVVATGALQPQLTERGGFFELEIDLATMAEIPAGYYAIIECGWSERGAHKITEFELTFEQLKAVAISDISTAEWHLYFGVNGQWDAIWTADDAVRAGSIVGPTQRNRRFTVRTIDDMPLVIRDCGVEPDFIVEGPNKLNKADWLDRVEITVTGPDYLDQIEALVGDAVFNRTSDEIRFLASGWELADPEIKKVGEDRHQWLLNLKQRTL